MPVLWLEEEGKRAPLVHCSAQNLNYMYQNLLHENGYDSLYSEHIQCMDMYACVGVYIPNAKAVCCIQSRQSCSH